MVTPAPALILFIIHLLWHTEHLSKASGTRGTMPDSAAGFLTPCLSDIVSKMFPVTAGAPRVLYKEFHPESGWLPAELVSVFSSHYAAQLPLIAPGNPGVVWLGKEFKVLSCCRCRQGVFQPRRQNGPNRQLSPGVYSVKENSTAATFRKLVILPGDR